MNSLNWLYYATASSIIYFLADFYNQIDSLVTVWQTAGRELTGEGTRLAG
jgi:hypothetical protein